MNKRSVIISTAILLTIGGGVGFLLLSDGGRDAKNKMISDAGENSVQSQNTEPVQVNKTASGSGTYIDYEEGIITNTTGTKILFFHAPWCPQCRELEADIKKRGVPDGVAIIRVDYDSSQKLRRKYGVTIQTTMVKIDDHGELVEKYVAYDEPSLDAVVKNLL